MTKRWALILLSHDKVKTFLGFSFVTCSLDSAVCSWAADTLGVYSERAGWAAFGWCRGVTLAVGTHKVRAVSVRDDTLQVGEEKGLTDLGLNDTKWTETKYAWITHYDTWGGVELGRRGPIRMLRTLHLSVCLFYCFVFVNGFMLSTLNALFKVMTWDLCEYHNNLLRCEYLNRCVTSRSCVTE